MHKKRLFELLATKSFSKLCKSGSIKLSFLTKTATFFIKKFQQSWGILSPAILVHLLLVFYEWFSFLTKILETFVPAKGCMQFISIFQDFC